MHLRRGLASLQACTLLQLSAAFSFPSIHLPYGILPRSFISPTGACTSTRLLHPARPTSFSTRAEDSFHLSRRARRVATWTAAAAGEAGKLCVEQASRSLQYFVDPADKYTPIFALTADEFESWLAEQDETAKAWAASLNFAPKAWDSGKQLLVPGPKGLSSVVVIVGDSDGYGKMFSFSSLPSSLPKNMGPYKFETLGGATPMDVALGWALGCYSYDRYKSKGSMDNGDKFSKVVWPQGVDRDAVKAAASATFLVRDLISTPSEDLGPAAIQAAMESLAEAHGAKTSSIVGDDLLTQGYPQVHAVGRAADAKHAPRLVELKWGTPGKPKVALVGKGVTFDSGGLDIKPATAMRLMKKDMGGGAQTIGLAHMIMASKLDVDLRVLVPAVENAIAGNSFRPGDILTARGGLTTEIGNTDAEGRLVLADALVAACEDKPDILINCATLTGAARVAMGTDVPAVFVNNDEVAERLCALSKAHDDLVWRLPLFKGYVKQLDSKIADMKNIGEGGYGGAITAALYLEKFVTPETPWIHVDFMAYNTGSRPGRPEGGEAMGMRALFALLKERYSK